MRVRLVPINGGEAIELTRPITVVGRRRSCDICLEHPSVSKVHLVLVQTDGAVLFRDLGSTNGTKVNGKRVRRGALLPGDTLSVAGQRFKVEFVADGDAMAASATELMDEPERQRPDAVRRVFRADELQKGAPSESDELHEGEARPADHESSDWADAPELPPDDDAEVDTDRSGERRGQAEEGEKQEEEPYRSSLLFPELDE